MIDASKIVKTVMGRLKGLPAGHHIDLRSYKRDRSLRIVKKDDEHFLFQEQGFFCEEFVVQYQELKRALQKIVRREFPRSRKIRLYNLGLYDAQKSSFEPRKVL